MTIAYDLYGGRELSLLLAKEHVEEMLGVSLEERESSYQGGIYYVWGRNDSEHYVLKVNVDPFDEEPVEQDFPDFPVLLYINATERSSSIEEVVRKDSFFKLLRHEVF
ncbi:hypothetical protein [Phytopseudomonas flavescens]|uniref:hypothetical protein n=1 Tax=Phytopseudomonas flavescens TaxID=29435 RepID=UPI000A056910|nr:hypothetical protein [Pseudomonas flavescens]